MSVCEAFSVCAKYYAIKVLQLYSHRARMLKMSEHLATRNLALPYVVAVVLYIVTVCVENFCGEVHC